MRTRTYAHTHNMESSSVKCERGSVESAVCNATDCFDPPLRRAVRKQHTVCWNVLKKGC